MASPGLTITQPAPSRRCSRRRARSLTHQLELASLVAAIDRGDAPGWRALEAARALPDAEPCSATALAGARPAPTGPRVAAAERLLAETRTENRIGRSERARALGAQAVAAARAIGDPRLLAEALDAHSRAVDEIDQVARRALLEEAVGVASESGDLSLEARIASELLDQAVSERVPERMSALLPIAAAALRRAGAAADRVVRIDAKNDEAQALAKLGRYDDAARACDELAALKPEQGPSCRCHLALERDRGDGVPACEEALVIAERVWGVDHPEVALALANLAEGVRNAGGYQRAIALARRAVAIDERTHGERSLRVQHDLGVLANALVDATQFAESAEVTSRALALLEQTPGKTDRVRAILLSQRAEQYVHLDKPEAGRRDAIDALAAAERHYGRDHQDLPYYHFRLAQTLKMGLGDCAGAMPEFRRAAELTERTLGKQSEIYLISVQGAAECLIRLERPAEARPLFEEALAILPTIELQPYNRAMLFAAYGECLSLTGDRKGALRELGKARELLVAIPEAKDMVEQVDAFVKQL